jgi:hypothetical protein
MSTEATASEPTITEQIKDVFNSIKERYVNPFALIFITYVVFHNWKFFYVIMSETDLDYHNKLKLADEYWEMNSLQDFLLAIGYSLAILVVGLVITTLSKSITDLWTKFIRNKVITIIDKTEIATQENLKTWKAAYFEMERKNNELQSKNDSFFRDADIFKSQTESYKQEKIQILNEKETILKSFRDYELKVSRNKVIAIYMRAIDDENKLSNEINMVNHYIENTLLHDPIRTFNVDELQVILDYFPELIYKNEGDLFFTSSAKNVIELVEKLLNFA